MRSTIAVALALNAFLPSTALASLVKVQAGDTLSEIATRHKISINELIKINGIRDSNHLTVGSTLKLPVSKSIDDNKHKGFYEVRPGDTISYIANLYSLSEREIINLNNLSNNAFIYPGQKINLPSSNKRPIHSEITHLVIKGDTLGNIAKNYNINQSEIISLNLLPDSDYLYPGQKIRIPKYTNSSKRTNTPENKITNYSPAYHIVKRGETLSKISKIYNVSINDLIKINQIKSPNKLSQGERLYLKGRPYKKASESNYYLSNKEAKKFDPKYLAQDWRAYGPLKVNWSNWQSLGGSYVTPTINNEGKALYLAINCSVKKINATGLNGAWKTWSSPMKKFEHQLLNDLCKMKTS